MKTLYCLVKFHWIYNDVSQLLWNGKKLFRQQLKTSLSGIVDVNFISSHFFLLTRALSVQTSDENVEHHHLEDNVLVIVPLNALNYNVHVTMKLKKCMAIA